MTYCGPLGEGSGSLIAWLSAVPGVHPIHPGANPATWMLVRTLARLHPLMCNSFVKPITNDRWPGLAQCCHC